jgi:hypothetical protein
MTEPLVCAIMLTSNRPFLASKAMRCFRYQTYKRRTLLLLHTGLSPYSSGLIDGSRDNEFLVSPVNVDDTETIGYLRNYAGHAATEAWQPDIFVHWDDDDWSHPRRIQEQVAHLQDSGADIVGYNQMLFWRMSDETSWLYSNKNPHYALGTSLCYWSRVWKDRDFSHTSSGEDLQFCAGRNVKARPSVRFGEASRPPNDPRKWAMISPRMVARIHDRNTSSKIDEKNEAWRRVPEWDDTLRRNL